MLGTIPVQLLVTDVDERFVYCGGPHGWKFDRITGMEVDEELGWGPQFGITGSYLLPPGETEVDVTLADDDARRALDPDAATVPAFVRFRTMTGSRYEVDNANRSWRRTDVTLGGGRLRSESGRLVRVTAPEVGLHALLVGPRLHGGSGVRIVTTSPVVVIEEASGELRWGGTRGRSRRRNRP
jgi:hypothetical protein